MRGEERERRQEPPDPAQARRDRRERQGLGWRQPSLRLRGRQDDGACRRRRRSCASARSGCLAGEPVRSIARDLNERGVPTASGGEWSPQSLRRMLARRGSAASASTRARSSPTAEWPAIISAERRRGDPRAARRPGAADEQGGTALPARRAACRVATAASAGRAAPRGRSAPLCLRERAGLLRLRQDVHQRRRRRAVRRRSGAAPARLAASAAQPSSGGSASARTPSAG